MKKMRKYSGSTGLKVVPGVPSTFIARSSPHFMAALSGKPGQDPRKTSVYKMAVTSSNVPRKPSTIFQTNLPMIHVTAMDEVEQRNAHSESPQRKFSSQRKISSSYGPFWTRGGVSVFDKNEGHSSTSNTKERQRKISVKKGASVLGETPHGKDLIFRRKISSTATPAKKVNKAEEKEKLLTKYSLLENAKLNNDSKRRMRKTYFSRYDIETSLLQKGHKDSNRTARDRAQSLNFVPKGEGTLNKEKTKNKIFTPRLFPGVPMTDNVFARDRAQSLNLVLRGSGSGKTRAMNDKKRGLYEITEVKQDLSPPQSALSAESNLQVESVVKTNQLQGPLLLCPEKDDYKLDNKLSPTRDNVHTAPSRKVSQDRNAFLTFPSLRAKPSVE